MTADLRLRQSYSGYLLGRNGKCLAELKRDMTSGRTPTKAMEDGSLVDQLLFGGGNFTEIAECTKRGGPDKGEKFQPTDYTTKDAQEQRDEIRATGRIPVLSHEVDRAIRQRDSLLAALKRAGIDLAARVGCKAILGDELLPLVDDATCNACVPPGIYTQPKILWSEGGVRMSGTLDILEVRHDRTWRIIDTKLSARSDKPWLDKQACAYGWDVQAGAYREAAFLGLGLDPEKCLGYGLAVCDKASGLDMSTVHWLTDMFLRCGDEQWRLCKERWQAAVESNEWPEHADGELDPPGWYVSQLFDGSEESGGLEDLGLDMTGIEGSEKQ